MITAAFQRQNKWRATLTSLSWSDGLAIAAQDFCYDVGLAGTENATDGSSTADRVARYGTFKGFVGQSVFYGDGTATDGKSIMDAMVKNSKNRKLLQSKFR